MRLLFSFSVAQYTAGWGSPLRHSSPRPSSTAGRGKSLAPVRLRPSSVVGGANPPRLAFDPLGTRRVVGKRFRPRLPGIPYHLVGKPPRGISFSELGMRTICRNLQRMQRLRAKRTSRIGTLFFFCLVLYQ